MHSRVRLRRHERALRMHEVLLRLYPNARTPLNFTTDFELLVAVILSAQCTDERVNKVTASLFLKYRTVRAYRDAPLRELERAIYSCGFYRTKARSIQGAARMVHDEYGGVVPRSLEKLLTLPGVARKTAQVVRATLGEESEGIAVDTHIRRFAIRFDLTDHDDPRRIERDLMEVLPRELWWSFPHRLVHYGRDYCSARPHDCTEHPLTPLFPEAGTRWPKSHGHTKQQRNTKRPRNGRQ